MNLGDFRSIDGPLTFPAGNIAGSPPVFAFACYPVIIFGFVVSSLVAE
jgi:hypothetical protein